MDLQLGEKLQMLRKKLNYNQKDFAEYLGIPQPSLSAYENNKNSPTIEVLFNIAKKCNISLDWLCGLTDSTHNKLEINELKDVATLLYNLMEIEEIGIEIEVNDKLPNDLETETNKWYTQLRIYGKDKRYLYNADLCNIISSIKELNLDVDSFEIDEEMYKIKKERDLLYYKDTPLSRRVIPELTREERRIKRNEYLENIFKKDL